MRPAAPSLLERTVELSALDDALAAVTEGGRLHSTNALVAPFNRD